MQPQQKSKITHMLTQAYCKLGIHAPDEQSAKVNEAWDYLCADREHYIEVVDADTPLYLITIRHGRICRLVPLAREIIRSQVKDHIREHTVVLSLMLSDSGNRYVYGSCYADLYKNPVQNTYSYPVYHYAELEDFRSTLRVCSPQEIRPAATALDWEAYSMAFAAFAHLCRDEAVNSIPHKTERAMQRYSYELPQELTIEKKRYLGKLVPLAWEESLWEPLMEDHLYSYRNELCLLVTGEKPFYVMKTTHTYKLLQKESADHSSGDPYKPTNRKFRTTYAFATLSDLSQDIHPLYN